MDINDNPYYKKAQEFIAAHNLSAIAPGTYMIEEGKLFYRVIEGNLRPVEAAPLEAHNEYADIQIPLSTAETYGTKPRKDCQDPKAPFDEKSDCILYNDTPTAFVTVQPGEQIIFEPDTAHAPMIGEGPIKKALFKVRVL